MNKIFTNAEIYNISASLVEAFEKDNQNYFSAKINFMIQKNKSLFVSKAIEIEHARLAIIQKYGTRNEENSNKYDIAPDKIDVVNAELTELLSIEQEINIFTFSMDDLTNVEFTPAQMEAIMFMVEEEAKE